MGSPNKGKSRVRLLRLRRRCIKTLQITSQGRWQELMVPGSLKSELGKVLDDILLAGEQVLDDCIGLLHLLHLILAFQSWRALDTYMHPVQKEEGK